jgi:hypothetical protein
VTEVRLYIVVGSPIVHFVVCLLLLFVDCGVGGENSLASSELLVTLRFRRLNFVVVFCFVFVFVFGQKTPTIIRSGDLSAAFRQQTTTTKFQHQCKTKNKTQDNTASL